MVAIHLDDLCHYGMIALLRFGVHEDPDERHGIYYSTTRWYHPICFGQAFGDNPACRQVENIENNAGLSGTALRNKLDEIFGSNSSESSDDDSSSNESTSSEDSSSSTDLQIVQGGQRMFVVDGINFRARVNRLENLTVRQLKLYCTENEIDVPSSMRKAALAAMIRRDITRHIR